ncbi:unnamed protein product [Camellia sinensis]
MSVTKEYLEELWQLALKIAGALSEGLGLDRDYIEKSLGEGCQIAAFNYYPPCPEPNKTLGLAAHSDHGGVIILMENDVAGLQVKHNHTWVAIPHVPGSFVVNIGAYTEWQREMARYFDVVGGDARIAGEEGLVVNGSGFMIYVYMILMLGAIMSMIIFACGDTNPRTRRGGGGGGGGGGCGDGGGGGGGCGDGGGGGGGCGGGGGGGCGGGGGGGGC